MCVSMYYLWCLCRHCSDDIPFAFCTLRPVVLVQYYFLVTLYAIHICCCWCSCWCGTFSVTYWWLFYYTTMLLTFPFHCEWCSHYRADGVFLPFHLLEVLTWWCSDPYLFSVSDGVFHLNNIPHPTFLWPLIILMMVSIGVPFLCSAVLSDCICWPIHHTRVHFYDTMPDAVHFWPTWLHLLSLCYFICVLTCYLFCSICSDVLMVYGVLMEVFCWWVLLFGVIPGTPPCCTHVARLHCCSFDTFIVWLHSENFVSWPAILPSWPFMEAAEPAFVDVDVLKWLSCYSDAGVYSVCMLFSSVILLIQYLLIWWYIRPIRDVLWYDDIQWWWYFSPSVMIETVPVVHCYFIHCCIDDISLCSFCTIWWAPSLIHSCSDSHHYLPTVTPPVVEARVPGPAFDVPMWCDCIHLFLFLIVGMEWAALESLVPSVEADDLDNISSNGVMKSG